MLYQNLFNIKPKTALDVILEAYQPDQLTVLAYDEDHPKAVYYRRSYAFAPGPARVFLPFPVTPPHIRLQLGSNGGVQVLKIETPKLRTGKMPESKKLHYFVKEVLPFCQKMDDLPTGVYGKSAEESPFYINFVDIITTRHGQALNTSALTYVESGNIEVSKVLFGRLTVPERVFTLLHEFAHYELGIPSDYPDAELFCDAYAFKIFVILGFDPADGLEVIKNLSPTPLNRERYRRMADMIMIYYENI